MQEFLTAVWLEAAYQIFRSDRGSRLSRERWYKKASRAIPELERRRASN
jgi:hypothetical protein